MPSRSGSTALHALLAIGLQQLVGVGMARAEPAPRVVVLELRGDARGKLHREIERALRASGRLEVVPSSKYRAAARPGAGGPEGTQPPALAHAGSALKVVAVVTGRVGQSFKVQILDADGLELWGKDIPLEHGLLSPDILRRLVSAVAAAATTAGGQVASPAPSSEPKPVLPTPDAPTAASKGGDLPPVRTQEVPLAETPAGVPSSPRVEARQPENHRGQEAPPPPWLAFFLGPTATSRSYCARPGVSTCAAYDAQPAGSHAAGSTVDFVSKVPYLGGDLRLEVLPLARTSGLLRGLGLAGAYARGFSQTDVSETSASGPTPPRSVSSVEVAYELSLLARRYFSMGEPSDRRQGYFGLRAGYGGRSFSLQKDAFVTLPGTHRSFPLVGLEGSYPLWSFLKVEGAAALYLGAHPNADDTVNYGTAVSTSAFALEGGLGGSFGGALGYELRFRFARFADTFTGAGVEWQTGGAAQESYAQLRFALTAHF